MKPPLWVLRIAGRLFLLPVMLLSVAAIYWVFVFGMAAFHCWVGYIKDFA